MSIVSTVGAVDFRELPICIDERKTLLVIPNKSGFVGGKLAKMASEEAVFLASVIGKHSK